MLGGEWRLVVLADSQPESDREVDTDKVTCEAGGALSGNFLSACGCHASPPLHGPAVRLGEEQAAVTSPSLIPDVDLASLMLDTKASTLLARVLSVSVRLEGCLWLGQASLSSVKRLSMSSCNELT